jgi:diaminopimelate epimerase
MARVELPGGPLTIAWDGDPASSVWMSGPAEAVFDGMVTPELWGEGPAQEEPAAAIPPSQPSSPDTVDCATACINGCLRPENCPSAEARARAMALLQNTSLDGLVTMASESLEARTRARFSRGL